jgi:hypothetical protein
VIEHTDAVGVVELNSNAEFSVPVVWILEYFLDCDYFLGVSVFGFVNYSESALTDDFNPLVPLRVSVVASVLFAYLVVLVVGIRVHSGVKLIA